LTISKKWFSSKWCLELWI